MNIMEWDNYSKFDDTINTMLLVCFMLLESLTKINYNNTLTSNYANDFRQYGFDVISIYKLYREECINKGVAYDSPEEVAKLFPHVNRVINIQNLLSQGDRESEEIYFSLFKNAPIILKRP